MMVPLPPFHDASRSSPLSSSDLHGLVAAQACDFAPSPAASDRQCGRCHIFIAAVHIAERGRSSLLSLAVLPLLRSTFAADWESLLARRGRSVQNLTCMRPQTSIDGAMLFDDDLLSLPLQPGG